jgi:NAD(P)-dependent dehydrogenase (short-subunit alcohol dehydrogenase family)
VGERLNMSNKIDLNGKFAVVTGGAQGIGRAIVERFLDSGAAVAIWDRDLDFAKKTATELGKRGRVEAVAVDVTDYVGVERARDQTVKLFGRIDILVNNAGIAGINTTTWEYPVEEWRKVLSINLDGPFHCCKAIAPGMIAQNYGRIVNIASVAGKEGNPNAPALEAE